LVVLTLLLPSVLLAHEFDRDIPKIELGPAKQWRDGFRLEVESAIFPPNPREGRNAIPLVGFTFRVPARVAHTYIGLVFLEIHGGKDETRLFALLDHRKHGDKEQYLVTAERHVARDCVIHFEYKETPDDELMIKDYIVRLKYYMPKSQ